MSRKTCDGGAEERGWRRAAVLQRPEREHPRLREGREEESAARPDRDPAAVGRARACPLLDYKFVTLSHNTLRGAAGSNEPLAIPMENYGLSVFGAGI